MCVWPPSKPRDGPPTTMPHVACPCPAAAANARGGREETRRPVRCRSGRHHSVARICLSPFELSTTRYPLPCLGVGDGQRRCDAKRGLLGEDERDEAAGSDESFAACRLPTASRTPGRSEIILYLRTATDLMISACVPLDLPRLMAFPHFSNVKARPCTGRTSRGTNAVLTGRSFLGFLACWLGSRGPFENRWGGRNGGLFPFFSFPSSTLTNPSCVDL